MGMVSNSQRLRRRIDLALPELLRATHDLQSHPRITELYPKYLFALHCVGRASVPLLEAALSRAHTLSDADAVATQLAPYLSKHIPEEMHSHWLLEDLEVLGFERAEILGRIPSPTVAAMVGSQYYWIFHHHPVALLGYIEVLEGYPPNVEQIEKLMKVTGYPREAFRSLLRHARLDLQHRDDLHEVLDNLPLMPEHWAIIGVSAFQTIHLASSILQEVVEQGAVNIKDLGDHYRAQM